MLVVDDNVDTARRPGEAPRGSSATTSDGPRRPSAIEVARTHRPEIVLLDIGLPGMDGYQVASELRAGGLLQESRSSSPSPGYGREDDRRRSREGGLRPSPGQAGRLRSPRHYYDTELTITSAAGLGWLLVRDGPGLWGTSYSLWPRRAADSERRSPAQCPQLRNVRGHKIRYRGPSFGRMGGCVIRYRSRTVRTFRRGNPPVFCRQAEPVDVA